MLVWLTMVTGFRRGELCAIRWRHVNLAAGVLVLERVSASAVAELGRRTPRPTSTGASLSTPGPLPYWLGIAAGASPASNALGLELTDDAFVFSLAVDGSGYLKPDSVSQRYVRLAARLGISTTIHKLRHYSATELISAGVDVRTVAGRLGPVERRSRSPGLPGAATHLHELQHYSATELLIAIVDMATVRPAWPR